MERTRNQESGIILVILIFVVAIGIFGYVAWNNVQKSREANELKDNTDASTEQSSENNETTEKILN